MKTRAIEDRNELYGFSALMVALIALPCVVVAALAFLNHLLKTFGVAWFSGVGLAIALAGVVVWLLRSN